MNSAKVEDFAGSIFGASVVFPSSFGAFMSNKRGALSEVDHSLGEVGDLGISHESKFIADMLPSRSRIKQRRRCIMSKLQPFRTFPIPL